MRLHFRHLLALGSLALIGAPLLAVLYELNQGQDLNLWQWFTKATTQTLLWRTLTLVFSVCGATIVLGTLSAVLLARTQLRLVKLWLTLAILPLTIPSYIGAFAWLSATGLRGFLGSWLVLTLACTPYVTISVYAALLRSNPNLEATARTLGKPTLLAFWHGSLRECVPAILGGGLIAGLYTVADFGVVSLMRYPTLTSAIHTAYTATFNRDYAYFLSLLLVVVGAIIVSLEHFYRQRVKQGQSTTSFTQSRYHLGKLTPLSYLFLLLSTLLALGMPILVLLQRTIQAIASGQLELLRLLVAAGNTLALGLAAAFVATLVAYPIASLSLYRRDQLSRIIDFSAYLAHAFPSLTVALAVVVLLLKFAPQIYQTVLALLVAYVIIFVPRAIAPIRQGLAQVPLSLTDTAKTLTRPPWFIWLRVTFPIAGPSFFAGLLLVAISIMKELPATLILRPTNLDTLATRMWQLTDIQAHASAAPYGLALVLIALVPTFLLVKQSAQA